MSSMIAAISGEIFEVTDESCTVMSAGVGYELICSLSTLAELQMQTTKSVTLFAYTHVREDALQLFGFLTKLEKNCFLSLMKVNGIGAKSAINILSGANPETIARYIETEDVKALSKLPKVGKKTAEQMILTLKGKLVLAPEKENNAPAATTPVATQIRSALVNLGFRPSEVEKVVTGLGEVSFEEGVRQGLGALTHL